MFEDIPVAVVLKRKFTPTYCAYHQKKHKGFSCVPDKIKRKEEKRK